ncbi:MAG: hypothetical protein ACP5OS_07670 [Leptospirillia bacterium]
MEAGEKKGTERSAGRLRERFLVFAGALLFAWISGCGNGSGSMTVSGGPTAVTFCPNNSCTYNSSSQTNGFNTYGQLNTIVTLLVDGKDNVWIPYNTGGISVLEIPAGSPGSAVTFCYSSSCNYSSPYYNGYSAYAYATDAKGNFWTLDQSNGSYFLEISSGNPANPVLYSCSGCPAIYGHTYMAIDTNGNIWLTVDGNIYKGTISSSTVTISEPYTNTGSSPTSTGIAVDPTNNNVWISGIVSISCTGSCNSSSGFVAEFNGTNTVVYCSNNNTSACPSGSISYTQSGELNLSSSYSSPYSSGSSGTAATASNIAVDSSGNVWVSQYGNNGLLEIPASSPNTPIFCDNGCGDGGSLGGGSPAGIAVDNKGRAWIASTFPNFESSNTTSTSVAPYTGGGISAQTVSGGQISAYASYCDFTVLKTNLAGCSQFLAFMFPQVVAIDSKGNVWIANNGFDNASAPNNNNNNNGTTYGWVTELIGAAK